MAGFRDHPVVVVALPDTAGKLGIGVYLRCVPPLGDHLDERRDVRESVCGPQRVHEFKDEGPYILGGEDAYPGW